MQVEPQVALPKIMLARYYPSTIGRFMSPDPSTDSIFRAYPQSWNRYTYVYNNPIRLVDPRGEEATAVVDEENKTINVTVEIDIWGPDASDEVAEEIEEGIEGEWSGQTYTDPETGTEYTVQVDAKVQNVGEDKANATAPNQIKIDASVKRDHVNPIGKVDTGKWNPNSGGKVFAHEAGHLLGLGDHYSRMRNLFKNPKNHEGHMMGAPGQSGTWGVVPHEVRDVVSPAVRQHNNAGTNPTTHQIHYWSTRMVR